MAQAFNVYTYLIDMPCSVHEMISEDVDGYTVYLNAKLSDADQRAAYDHAMRHIQNRDFERYDVQRIEAVAHKPEKPPSR